MYSAEEARQETVHRVGNKRGIREVSETIFTYKKQRLEKKEEWEFFREWSEGAWPY